MRTLKLTMAYDGTSYLGWQRQAAGPSIQGLIEAALARLDGGPVTVTGAGRTDAGVHAEGQVASARVRCTLDVESISRALNASLPPDVRVVGVDEVPADFHARHGARAKRYAYRVVNGRLLWPFDLRYAWHVSRPLDTAAMARALETLIGTHDFAAFRAAGSRVRDSSRTIFEAALEECDGAGFWRGADPAVGRGSHGGRLLPAARLVVITLRGDGFLRHMVRNIVGTLVEIGRGRWPPEYMAEVLASRDRSRAGPTAPAHGLFLVGVEYEAAPDARKAGAAGRASP